MTAGRAFDEALTNREKEESRKEFGVPGRSVLYKLYSLYGFDPVQDMVVDRMHLTYTEEGGGSLWNNCGSILVTKH